jgi:flagellar hook-associated protein 2
VNLSGSQIQTVGDVLDEINRLNLGVLARINDAGDGILLVDTAGGAATLRVQEGGSSTAKDLHLLGDAATVDLNGTPTKVIDGTTTFKIDLAAEDSLTTLVSKINALGAGVTAGIFNDGSSNSPYRLTLFSQKAGTAGQLLVDASQLGIHFEETTRAQDALLLFGSTAGSGLGILASSSTNTFNDILPGVTLTALAASEAPVTVTVSTTDTSLVAGVQAAVENFNRIRLRISEFTAFDAEQNTSGVLLGDGNVLRVENELASLLSGRFAGAGSIRSLETLGLSLKDDGTLAFDSAKFKAKFAEDAQAVEEFFTKEETGLAAKIDQIIEQLAGEENSLLGNRLSALGRKVDENSQKVQFLNDQLTTSRERLLTEFFRLELAVSKIQSNLSALTSLTQTAQNFRAATANT